ncbi:hypothetical protein [Paraburkholderia megapolitana]|uniref:Phage antitermination protein Q n=1 Tax=Paraburkholderia megapolitana TaxID=420953 RepID=A0A1I3U8W6_9BURK|nr:hypothetical protein [Paraburkholderia megapolitana]QDQ83629.1 hypothetical protein FNZ07_20890 [Paraburkholderia megapolitana]SFJ79153.1 hypothetical protein SAMN05192543_11140 [Paraburkholderia megapolitana]
MTLEERLENWARAIRGGAGGGDSLTANIYFQTVRGRAVNSTLDDEDAALVERTIRRLMPMDRKLLQMHYVWRASPPFICRKLGLRVRPTSIFDLALAHARRAIDEKLSESSVVQRPAYVSMKEIIEKLKEGVAQS